MKKIMFFTMLLGLMFVFSSTASAQGVVFKINGSGKMRPLVGEKITFTVHTLNADVPELGLKKGVNVCLIGVFSGGQQATIYLKIDCSKTKIGNNIAKITKVDNPVPEMICLSSLSAFLDAGRGYTGSSLPLVIEGSADSFSSPLEVDRKIN